MITRCRRNSFQLNFIRVVLVRLVHVVVLIKPNIVLYLNGPVLEDILRPKYSEWPVEEFVPAF